MEFTVSNDIHLHVRERAGNGETVLFVHGWAVTGKLWSTIFERWEGSERLLAVDLRGTGWSSKPRAGYSISEFAGDVVALIEHLDTPVILVGHSMGGAISQWVASAIPDRISKLVLVSPVPASGLPLAEPDLAFFRSLAGHRDGMRTIISSMLGIEAPDGLEELIESASTIAVECYLGALEAFTTADFADRLDAITAPVHVMGGACDQALNPDRLRAAVVSAFDGATFETIDGAGHYPHIETPDLFTTMLEAAVRA